MNWKTGIGGTLGGDMGTHVPRDEFNAIWNATGEYDMFYQQPALIAPDGLMDLYHKTLFEELSQ